MKRITLLAGLALLISACGLSTSAAGVAGAWQLVSGTHDGAAVPIVDSHPITLTIEGDLVGGTAACNGYGGKLELGSAGTFSLADVAITEAACAPRQVMESEQAFMAALGNANRMLRAKDTLTLSGPGTVLTFTALAPVPTANLVGTVWVLDGLISKDTVSSVGGDRATLTLSPDGTLAGGTGCRAISGEYLVSGAEVQFTSLTADGECPPELQDQDSRVISALEGGFRVEIDGDRMTTWTAGDEGLSYRADR